MRGENLSLGITLLVSLLFLFSFVYAENEITFNGGWNIIYNRYDVDIPVDSLIDCTRPIIFALGENIFISADTINKGEAYLVRVADDCSYDVGSAPLFNMTTLSLSSGWNVLGVNTEIPMANLTGECGDVLVMNLTGNRLVIEEDSLKPGIGYLVRVTNDCTINILAEDCIDTDDGKDYYLRGNVTSIETPEGIEDVCLDGYTLTEYSCGSDQTTESESHVCPDGCTNGACIRECGNGECDHEKFILFEGEAQIYERFFFLGNIINLTDTIDGNVTIIEIDGTPYTFSKNTTYEINATFGNLTVFVIDVIYNENGSGQASIVLGENYYTCPEDCGIETVKSCIDTDRGSYYYVSGAAKDEEGYFEDYCEDDNISISEFYCEDMIHDNESFSCPYGCINGACQLPESGVVDCGNEIDCFIEAAKECREANITYTTVSEISLFGLLDLYEINITNYHEIVANQPGTCSLFTKLDSIYINFSEEIYELFINITTNSTNMTRDEAYEYITIAIEASNREMDIIEGLNSTCNISSENLTRIFEAVMKENIPFLGGDAENCSGSLYDTSGFDVYGFGYLGTPNYGDWIFYPNGTFIMNRTNGMGFSINITGATLTAFINESEYVFCENITINNKTTGSETFGSGEDFIIRANCSEQEEGLKYQMSVSLVFDRNGTEMTGFNDIGYVKGIIGETKSGGKSKSGYGVFGEILTESEPETDRIYSVLSPMSGFRILDEFMNK